MKWSIEQLMKHAHDGLTFKETVDFSTIIPSNDDIISVAPTEIDGTFRYDDPHFVFHLTIQTTLQMACAKTLQPVDVPLHIKVKETFSHFVGDDMRLIEQNTVDLYPIVWSNIYLEKPLKVVHPDAKDLSFDSPGEKTGHPGLKDLEKFK